MKNPVFSRRGSYGLIESPNGAEAEADLNKSYRLLSGSQFVSSLYVQVYLIITLSLGSIETDRVISETVL